MHIQLIAKRESSMTGTLRYASDLYRGFKGIGLQTDLTFPNRTTVPASIQNGLKNFRIDLETFFANYPLRVRLSGADVYHLTGQMLATLLLFQRFPKPVVVSVLDIIPYLVRHQPEMNTFRHPGDKFFYRLALRGLRRADALIAISNYTRQTMIEALKIPVEQIHVVYPGVDLSKFQAMAIPEAFWSKYGLDKSTPYILFVGSEDPRKNLSTLIRVFALVKQQLPEARLLKVGPAHFIQERQKLLGLISSLNLEQDIFFLNHVQEDDLPFFYNAAELLVMPSFYEGFGLPVLEAMACGTPVIYSRTGSLPEVGGEAGIAVDPYDTQEIANTVLRLMDSPNEKSRMKQAGRERAAKFTLEQTIYSMLDVYEKQLRIPTDRLLLKDKTPASVRSTTKTTRMRILWIPHTSWHIPQRAHLFCRALAEGHEVHVTDWIADFSSLRDYLSPRYLQNFTYRNFRDGKITVHRVPRFSPALYVPALRHLNTAIFSRMARQIIERYKIDVVVGTFPLPPPKSPRLVFDLFDDNVAYWHSSGRAQGYAEEIAATESNYLKEADAVVAASSVLVDKAKALGARGPVHHIPNGVDLCLFQNLNGTKIREELLLEGKLVGSLANYDRPSELDKVLDAATMLASRDIIFLIAGRGTAIRPAIQRARREGITNVVFRGYVSPADAPAFINAFDVGLCSYTKSLMDDARSPMRLLMYAAAGLPTVCTNLEEVRRMRFPNVVLVEDDAQSLREGVERALQLPRVRPPQIEMYDLHNLVEQYEAVLRG